MVSHFSYRPCSNVRNAGEIIRRCAQRCLQQCIVFNEENSLKGALSLNSKIYSLKRRDLFFVGVGVLLLGAPARCEKGNLEKARLRILPAGDRAAMHTQFQNCGGGRDGLQ